MTGLGTGLFPSSMISTTSTTSSPSSCFSVFDSSLIIHFVFGSSS